MLPSCCFCKDIINNYNNGCNWCWLLWYSTTPPLMTTLDYFHWIEVQRGQQVCSLLLTDFILSIIDGWKGEGREEHVGDTYD